jgi:hypothetical protein
MRAFWRATGPCLMGCVPGGAGACRCPPAGRHPRAAGPPAWSGTARMLLTVSGSAGWPRFGAAAPGTGAPSRAPPRPGRPPRCAGRAGAGPRLSPAVPRRCRPGGGRTRRDGDRPGEYQVVNQHALGRVSRPEGATGCYARLATSRRRRSLPAIPRRVITPEYQRRAVRGTPAPDAGLRCRSLASLPGRYRPSFAASALGVDALVIW